MRRTKIVATLGPASHEGAVIEQLIAAGADVFRFNFSHGMPDDHKARAETVRAAARAAGRDVFILQDLQGPKLRVGTINGGAAQLEAGQRFTLDTRDAPGDATRAYLPHPEIFAAASPGKTLLIDDGRIRLRITAVADDALTCEVVTGGEIKDRKGVNVPDIPLNIPALTEKDRADIETGKEIGVDWVALSFVQRAKDLIEARGLVAEGAPLCAKIEKPQALDNLDDIIRLADGIMIARGDLGVELPPESVPGRQLDIIGACRKAGKPVIVATQMLESMVTAAAPTRAEASDVATAVFGGADAVMLSAESAAGKHPVEAVAMMGRIIAAAEAHPRYEAMVQAAMTEFDETVPHAVAETAAVLAGRIGAQAIFAFTKRGTTAQRVSRERPLQPILAIVPDRQAAARAGLLWGVQAVIDPAAFSIEELDAVVKHVAQGHGFGASGAHTPIVAIAGFPFGQPGATNLIKVV